MNCFSHHLHAVNGASLRRFLAVLVAATFLVTGVVHAATCLDSAASPAGIAVVTDIADGSASHTTDDSPAKATLDIGHCHGCSAAAAPTAAPHDMPVATSTNVFAAVTYSIDADQRPSDPPPPKS
jgi:hypothetical protein